MQTNYSKWNRWILASKLIWLHYLIPTGKHVQHYLSTLSDLKWMWGDITTWIYLQGACKYRMYLFDPSYSLKPFCFTFRNPIWHSETVMAVEGAAKIIKVLLFVFNFIFFVRTNQLRPWSNEFLSIPRFQRSVASSGNVTMLGDQQNLRIRKKYSRSRPHLNHPFNQQATIGFLQMFVMVFFIN